MRLDPGFQNRQRQTAVNVVSAGGSKVSFEGPNCGRVAGTRGAFPQMLEQFLILYLPWFFQPVLVQSSLGFIATHIPSSLSTADTVGSASD